VNVVTANTPSTTANETGAEISGIHGHAVDDQHHPQGKRADSTFA
jgi:hypothetical protein